MIEIEVERVHTRSLLNIVLFWVRVSRYSVSRYRIQADPWRRRRSRVTNDEAAKKLIYGKRILQRVARIEESEEGGGLRAVRRQSTSTCRPSR